MLKRKKRGGAEINSSSMADIAFLLLIFFLVTTTIASDKGLTIKLPPKLPEDERQEIKFNQRNIFKVLVNSQDKLLVEGEPLKDVKELREMTKEFVLNFGKRTPENQAIIKSLTPGQQRIVMSKGRKDDSSESPDDAVVSFKADRGTSYEMYISILDQLQGAYYEIYAERVGLTTDDFRNLDKKNPRQKELYERGKEGIPMNISIAEPTNVGQ